MGDSAMGGLNKAQARRVLSTFGYVDELLRRIERLAREDRSPFELPRPDLAPEEARLLLAQAARLRGQMLEALARLGLEPPPHRGSARWSIRTALQFAWIELEQLDTAGLRGYGEVDPAAGDLLGAMTARMAGLARRASAALGDLEPGGLSERLARVAPPEGDILRAVDREVRGRGLAEVRSLLEAAVDSALATTFDVGVFGRIGAGKSSLINALLGEELLPVGARPVTSVATLVTAGERRARVLLDGGEEAVIGLDELRDYVTEDGNPGNRKDVARVEVSHPAVPDGLRFLDTPGVGSLASGAAAQTFAWLPRCDLGLLLIAAGGAVERDDLALASGLGRAGIDLHVLLSKVDLLVGGADERDAAVRHVGESLARVSGERAPEVVPVSVRPAGSGDLRRFRETVLDPLAAGYGRRRRAALSRRLGELERATQRAIEARRRDEAPPAVDRSSPEEWVAADREQRETRRVLRAVTDALSGSTEAALDRAAGAVAAAWERGDEGGDAARAAFLDYAGEALAEVRRAVEGDGSPEGTDPRRRLPPVFDPAWLDGLPDLSPPPLSGLAPYRRARGRLATVEADVGQSLTRYAARLFRWGESLLQDREEVA